MNFTAEQLQENFDRLIAIIDEHIASPRKEKLIEFYQNHAERIMLMPASSTDHHHNAFPGGYVDHVIRVVNCALSIKFLWAQSGAYINYTDEELVFAALNHDLGKIGTQEAEQYLPNDSEWHRKNLGKLYKYNPANPFLPVPERSLFLLQEAGIQVSLNEYLGIRLHDGLYDDANKPFYISHSRESKLRSNLPIILHHADHMAARIEFEMWDRNIGSQQKVPPAKSRATIPADISPSQKEDLQQLFNKLFE
jgi:hypothetical protein